MVFKLFFVSLLAFSTSCHAIHSTHSSRVQDKDLEQYISQYLDHLFYPHHQHPNRKTLINGVVAAVRKSTMNQENSWNWSAWTMAYNRDYIEKIMRTEILQWVKNNAYISAQSLGQDATAAAKAADTLHKQLLHRMSHVNQLSQGFLAPYVGPQLNDHLAKNVASTTPTA
jgi:hypothetical protein